MQLVLLKYITSGKIARILEAQFEKDVEFIYNTPSEYRGVITDLFTKGDETYHIVILGKDKTANRITKVYIGNCRLLGDYKLIIKRSYNLSEGYIETCLQFYENQSGEDLNRVKGLLFIREVDAAAFYSLLKRFIRNMNELKQRYKVGSYADIDETQVSELVKELERGLSPLAQKSQYAKRPLGVKKPQEHRTEFQRDGDRIIHAKAFRRLVDKTQIYTSAKGDHFRTRITHSLEVVQIAKGIARMLSLNEDLTETIALAHDIGHTPFGHEGERELHLIMSGTESLVSGYVKENFGGFKHNFQGLRIVNYLEEKYSEYEGLDLTYQVLEGILKHTTIKKCNYKEEVKKCDFCTNICFDIKQFLIIGDETHLHLEYDFPTTLEGQIVAVADEIAQRGHDLDDGLASGVLTVDGLLEDFKRNQIEDLVDIFEKARKEIQQAKQPRRIINEQDLISGIIVPKVIQFFFEKLVKETSINMKNYINDKQNMDAFNKEHIIKQKLIQFHAKDKQILDYLETVITQKVINSQEVNCFDGKSAYIIRKLFKAYYNNPQQLPDGVVKRIEREIAKHTTNVTNIRNGHKENVAKEIAIYQGREKCGNEFENKIKRGCFMRCLADFIGGMTDEFANEQFKKLYFP